MGRATVRQRGRGCTSYAVILNPGFSVLAARGVNFATMSSEKVARWEGMTGSHGFNVKVFGNREQGLFSAHIEATSPALAPVIRGGEKTPMMHLEDPAKIIDIDDFDTLKAFTRKHITERFGKILQWREYEEPTR